MNSESELRNCVVATANKMADSGLSPGRSGNISARYKDGFLITPSALAYGDLVEEDIVLLDLEGTVVSGFRKPSTEFQFHSLIYKNFIEASAVLHCHSTYATTLACLGRKIPAFHYMVAVAGGEDIRCCDYATFGSRELAQKAIDALKNRTACLLGNHGQLAYSDSLESVYELASEVENLSKVYWASLQIGKPNLLETEEMQRVLEMFKSYRQN